eukprot:794005_1
MTFLDTLEDALCVYKSTRFIRVKNRKLAIIYYACILAVLLYIVLYTVWQEKGYQETTPVTGTSSVKLKGTGSTGGHINSTAGTVYDAMDLVYPSLEEDAFFVTTSMIITPNQQRDYCPGNKDVPACNSTNYKTVCLNGTYSAMSQGIYTGNCCYSNQTNQCSNNYTSNDRCEVKAWCPNEHDSKSVAQHVVNIGAFTAFVKVDIAFRFKSGFAVSRSNTYDINHDGSPSDGYNLFTLDEIIGNATNGKITNVSNNIITNGAIILMESQWDCNLDKGENKCNPTWKFERIDSQPGTMSYGFNYRTVTYDINMSRRMLRKLYGIRVVFTTSGTGGRFSFAALTVTFGAGVAYLGAAAFISDIVLERFLPQSQAYARMKTKVTDDKKIISMSSKNVNNPDHYHNLSLSTHDEEAGTIE